MSPQWRQSCSPLTTEVRAWRRQVPWENVPPSSERSSRAQEYFLNPTLWYTLPPAFLVGRRCGASLLGMRWSALLRVCPARYGRIGIVRQRRGQVQTRRDRDPSGNPQMCSRRSWSQGSSPPGRSWPLPVASRTSNVIWPNNNRVRLLSEALCTKAGTAWKMQIKPCVSDMSRKALRHVSESAFDLSEIVAGVRQGTPDLRVSKALKLYAPSLNHQSPKPPNSS